MSNDNLTPIDMGFAEFVTKLISEVFDAVVTSQAEQQEKLVELQEVMLLSDEDFTDHLLQQDSFIKEVDQILESYFPSENSEHLHAIYEGAPYQPKKSNSPEKPAIAESLGVKLLKADYNDSGLTLSGVLKTYQKAARPFAIQKRNVISKLLEQGLSNIVVDSGKINAKLTFSTSFAGSASDESESGSADTTQPTTNLSSISPSLDPTVFRTHLSSINTGALQPIQPINRYVGILKPDLNKQVRLTVKQASNKSPQDVEAKGNIFSEVELNFKTIR